ncbi:MAG: phosphoglycerate kinase [Syntrophobacteria bacterium]
MKVRCIDEVSLAGRKVFIRVDFNVPLTRDGRVANDHRIRAALPTLRYAMEQGGRLIIASHLGRPKGKPVPELSLEPVGRSLEEVLARPVKLAPDCVGPEVESIVRELGDGELLLLENVRFHPEEAANEAEFGKALAAFAEVYVNEAFAVSHRAHASVVGITNYVAECAAGFLLKQELDYFHRSMENPERPLVAVLGGAKVSTKLPVLRQFASRVDRLLIGGALANTFLKSMGASQVEEGLVEEATRVMSFARERGVEVLLPVDFVVAQSLEADAAAEVVARDQVAPGWAAYDVGPETRRQFAEALKGARTIIWNGPMGAFEYAGFEAGTMAMASAVAESEALSVVGGGDTESALQAAGKAAEISYISTGGGAFLELFEGRSLPGLEALETCGT